MTPIQKGKLLDEWKLHEGERPTPHWLIKFIDEMTENRPNNCCKCGRSMDDTCFRCEVEDA